MGLGLGLGFGWGWDSGVGWGRGGVAGQILELSPYIVCLQWVCSAISSVFRSYCIYQNLQKYKTWHKVVFILYYTKNISVVKSIQSITNKLTCGMTHILYFLLWKYKENSEKILSEYSKIMEKSWKKHCEIKVNSYNEQNKIMRVMRIVNYKWEKPLNICHILYSYSQQQKK